MRLTKYAIRVIREQTKEIEALTKGMARMGAFDDLVKHRMKYKTPPQPKFSDINLDDLKSDDARMVVIAGLHNVPTPNMSYFKDGTWEQRTAEQQRKVLLDTAVEKGLDLFRKELRKNMEDGYVKMPAKPRNT